MSLLAKSVQANDTTFTTDGEEVEFEVEDIEETVIIEKLLDDYFDVQVFSNIFLGS
jgi:hypothetical protein